MTIEFVGLPGVGKTTVARALEEYGFECVRVRTRRELISQNLRFCALHPAAFAKLFYRVSVAGIRQGRFYPMFMNVLLDTNARVLEARRRPRGVLDQAYMQGLLSMATTRLTEEQIARYVHSLPQPDMLFVLTASDETRRERLRERGYGARTSPRAWVEHLDLNMQVLTRYVTGNQGLQARVISTEGEVADVANEILEHMGVGIPPTEARVP